MLIGSIILDPTAIELFSALKEVGSSYGLDFIFFTNSQAIARRLSREGCSTVKVAPHAQNNSERSLFEDHPALRLAESDPILREKDFNYRRKIVDGFLRSWTEALAEHSPDICISGDGCEIVNTTFSWVLRERHVQTLYTNGGSVFPGRMFWDNTIMMNQWLKEKKARHLEEDTIREAVEYVQQMKEKQPLLGTSLATSHSMTKLKHFVDFFFKGMLPEFGGNPYRNPLRFLNSYVKQRLHSSRSHRYWGSRKGIGGFLYLPLHVPHDSQITLRAPAFIHQDELIKLCLESLPENVSLVIKEHPHAPGAIPSDWLRRFSTDERVLLLPPSVNSHELINQSQAIVTVNSDVGWEALLHMKPVVTLAQPFYAHRGMTYDAGCITTDGLLCYEAPNMTDRARESIELAIQKGCQYSYERVIEMVGSAMESTYPATLYNADGRLSKSVDTARSVILSLLEALGDEENTWSHRMNDS